MISNSRDQGNNGALRQGLKPALIMDVRMQASLQFGHQLTSCQDPNRTGARTPFSSPQELDNKLVICIHAINTN
jgi:hypothetical protein